MTLFLQEIALLVSSFQFMYIPSIDNLVVGALTIVIWEGIAGWGLEYKYIWK